MADAIDDSDIIALGSISDQLLHTIGLDARADIAIAWKAEQLPWLRTSNSDPPSEFTESEGVYWKIFDGGAIYYYERMNGDDIVRYCVGLEDRINVKFLLLRPAVLGLPTTSSRPTVDNRAVFSRFGNGRLYKVNGANEAFWVHGDIRSRWSELGEGGSNLGYPTSDEHSPPDAFGRCNHFEGGSIYWTPDTGAWEIYGAIRDKWASLGWETSYLGYPVSGELPIEREDDTYSGGRVQGFQRGEIRWRGDLGAGDFPTTVRLDTILETPSGTTIGGSSTWTMNRRGDWWFSGHLHNSGFFDLNVEVAARLNFVGPAGTTYGTPTYKGTTEGTGLGGSEPNRNFFWDDKGNSPVIRDFWDQGVASGGIATRVDVGAEPGAIIGAIVTGVFIIVGSIFLSSGPDNEVQACPGHRQWDGTESPGSITIYKKGDTPPPCPSEY